MRVRHPSRAQASFHIVARQLIKPGPIGTNPRTTLVPRDHSSIHDGLRQRWTTELLAYTAELYRTRAVNGALAYTTMLDDDDDDDDDDDADDDDDEDDDDEDDFVDDDDDGDDDDDDNNDDDDD